MNFVELRFLFSFFVGISDLGGGMVFAFGLII